MKILHIIASMDPYTGGTCQAIRNLALCAKEQDFTMEVVCLDDPESDYLAHESIRVHALGKGRTALSYHPALRPWLEKNLPHFDAVIVNGLWLYPGYLMSRLSRLPNAPPYFVFPHGMLDPWFQRAPGRRLKAIRNWFYWKLIENKVIANAKAVLFTCAEEMRLSRETFRPYQPKHQINVGFGISPPPNYYDGMLSAFEGKYSGFNGQPYFLFLSRIHPKKGVDLLIKAYAAVYHSPSTADISPLGCSAIGAKQGAGVPRQREGRQTPRLVIAGPGLETDYGKAMQKLASDLCPANSIFWPGMLTGDAKWGALYCAEAFVLVSHQENFGIAVAEALSCGKPVLVSNQINIWREIAEDKAGLVEADTLAGAEQMFRQWENLSPENRAAMKKSARSCYERHFGISMAAQKLLATMNELTGLSPRSKLISENA